MTKQKTADNIMRQNLGVMLVLQAVMALNGFFSLYADDRSDIARIEKEKDRLQSLKATVSLAIVGVRFPLRSKIEANDFRAIPRTVQRLEIVRGEICGEFFGSLESFGSLTHLDLSLSNVVDQDVIQIGKCRKLEHLDLSGTKVTGRNFFALQPTSLRELHISSCPITAENLLQLANCEHLQVLDIQMTKVQTISFDAIQKLQRFHAAGSEFARFVGIPSESVAGNLRKLHLSGSQTDDEFLDRLHWCSSLQDLDIDNTNVSKEGIRHLIRDARYLPKLESLTVSSNQVDKEMIGELSRNFPGINITRVDQIRRKNEQNKQDVFAK